MVRDTSGLGFDGITFAQTEFGQRPAGSRAPFSPAHPPVEHFVIENAVVWRAGEIVVRRQAELLAVDGKACQDFALGGETIEERLLERLLPRAQFQAGYG